MINTRLNRSDYLLLMVYFVVFVLAQSYDHTFNFDQSTYKFIEPDGSSYTLMNIRPSLKGYLVGVPTSVFGTISIVLIFFKWLIPKYLIRRKSYLIFSILGVLVLVIFGVFSVTIWHWSDDIPWETYPSVFDLVMKSLNNSASNAGLPLGILLTKKYFEAQVQVAQIEKKQKESELKLLHAQISPHFLFNNLNTLDSLIDSKPDQARKYITHLSALYRYLINTKDKEVVLLEEELSMIKNYFYLIETRFGGIYTFNISGDSVIDHKYLPVGTLQVLIENVVKHNRTILNKPIETTIRIESEQVVVTNNKTGVLEQPESFGTGLDNLKDRYALLFDKEINITNSDTEFSVCIPLIEIH